MLGNKDPTNWMQADCYAPVVAQWMVQLLAALSIKFRSTLKQGDCKNAFVQAKLPEGEVTIVCPPVGCPHSDIDTYWCLRKSLYGLKQDPKHWYNLISKHLESPEVGLHRCQNEWCLFIGNPLPGKPPLHFLCR